MATTKKQKTVAKKTATKKQTAKKVAKKTVAKRTYKRRADKEKIEIDQQVLPENLDFINDDRQEAASNSAEEAVNVVYETIRSKREAAQKASEDALRRLTYLDLTNLDRGGPSRTLLGLELGFLGYKYLPVSNFDGFMRPVDLSTIHGLNHVAHAEVLQLDHTHKLVAFITRETMMANHEGSDIGIMTYAQADIEVSYSYPLDGNPDMLEQNGATYIRID